MTALLAQPLLLAALGAAGLWLVFLTAWRPRAGAVAICLVVPLTAGLNLGSIGSLLKPDQVIVLLVFGGVMLHELMRGGQGRYSLLDVAVLAYCLGDLLLPFLVLWLSGGSLSSEALHGIAAPGEYLVVYLVFAREQPGAERIRLFLNLAMVAIVIVSLIGLLELVNAPFVRQAMAAAYQSDAQPTGGSLYRPASTVIHFSGLGAVGLFGYTLSLSLSASRSPGYRQWWLVAVMASSLLGMLASLTYAPLVALPFITILVCLRFRHLPRALLGVGAGAVAGLAGLWPFVAQRVAEQLGGGGSLLQPETLDTRLRYWQEFFVPAWFQHGFWLGTGTVLPGEIPPFLAQYVDNSYLDQAFRGGLLGIGLLLLLYAAIAVGGWRLLARPEPAHRALGMTAFALALALPGLGLTSEYLGFAGFSQLFWMVVGLVAAVGRPLLARRALVLPEPRRWWPAIALPTRAPHPTAIALVSPSTVPSAPATAGAFAGVVDSRSLQSRWPVPAPPLTIGWAERWGRVRPLWPKSLTSRFRSSIAGASAVVLFGFGIARLLGFAFSIAAARVLLPGQFGQLASVLATATIASFLVTSAPVGLSRFLARHRDDAALRLEYSSTWLCVLGVVLLLSAGASALTGRFLGLGPWLVAALVANVAGPAVLEAYLEVQRGLGRYARGVALYVAANLLQLVALLVLWRVALASPALLLLAYGLSSIALLPLFVVVLPVGIGFSPRAIRRQRLREVLHFMRPVLLQSVFYNVWISADLVLVEHLLGTQPAGYYGAAKTLSNVLILAPMALGFVILPRLAAGTVETIRRQLRQALGLAAAAAVPSVLGVAVAGRWVIALLFGPLYEPAAGPLLALAAGLGLYCFYAVLSNAWIALGRPELTAAASALAMLGTVGGGLLLIPHLGMLGAALAFAAGSLLQLAVVAAFSFREGILTGRTPAVGESLASSADG